MSFLERVTGLFKRKSKGGNGLSNPLNSIESQKTEFKSSSYGLGYSFPSWATGGEGSKWIYGLSGSGLSPILDHRTLRQNARSVYHDTPQAKALVDRYADTVIDCGLKLEAIPQSELLGVDPEKAEQWARKVETLFDLWASDKRSYRDETMNFYQAQRLVEIFQQRDNDYFCRFYYSARKDLLNPLQISFVDPNQIGGSAFTSTYGFNYNDDGIIRNATGKEIAYKVYVRDQKNEYKEIVVPASGVKSKRIMMIHGFMPEYAGQGRGYSRLSHALQDFENLTDFTSAQIKKAINQSNITMYTKPSKDNDASNPFEGISHQYGARPIPSESAQQVTPESALSLEDYVQYVPLPEATVAKPGSVGVFNLTEGEDLQPFKATAPAAEYDRFIDCFVSHLSASFSIPVEVLLMKFNQNYSASRGALILFWRIAQIWQKELKADFLDPVFHMWLAGEIAAGRISAPGWQDPRLRAAWTCSNWIGAPMPNIDPQRTMEADKGYVELGAQDLDRVARNYNGSSGAANRSRLARQFTELPVSPWQGQNKGGNENG